MKVRYFACAVALLAFVLSQAVADPVRSYESGKSFQEREDWYSAIESYQEALHENPSYNRVYQGLAESFYALGEYDQALSQVIKAEAYKKNDPELLDLHAFILIGLGKIDQASIMFKRVLSTWPNDVSARFGIAEIDIYAGRISAAQNQYFEALQRNPENRKALLSLALVSREAGNSTAAREYINKALQFHGDSPQVFYYAAYISSMDGQTGEAEKRIRTALSIKPDYDEARELLAAILYRSGRYSEVIDICDTRIASDRNRPSAWYLRALSMEKLNRFEEAIKSAQTGLQVAPDDEILRSLMEEIIISKLSFEDARRASWAYWHVSKAQLFEQKNMSDQAMYEYRRALKINPYDVPSRQAYGRLLLNRGYPARYVEQLKFIQSLGKSTNQVNDDAESYSKLLSGSVPNKWKIDPLYLEKSHTAITFYFQNDTSNFLHPDSERITTSMISEIFSYNPGFTVKAHETPVGSYSEAFRSSREQRDDYFALVKIRENNRDIQINVDLYVSRTGSSAKKFTVFRTGNDRYSNALRRLIQIITAEMPIRGAVVNRYQADAVIDLGKSEGIKVGQKFSVVPAAQVSVNNEGVGIRYDKANVLGTFTVGTVDEDVSQGKLERSGFFDRINAGDAVLLNPEPAATSAGTTVGGKTSAAAQGTGSAAKLPGRAVSAEPEQRTPPALLSLLRKIR